MLFRLIVTTALHCQGGDKGPTAEQVLELAMKQRQAITKASGTFRFVTEKPGSKVPKQERVTKIWLDGSQLRNDHRNEIGCRNCEKEGEYIRFAGPSSPPSVLKYGKLGPGEPIPPLTDPRVLGLQVAPSGALYAFQIDTVLGTKDRTLPTLEKGKWNGYDCYVVRFDLKAKATLSLAYTIVPAMDHSVTEIQGEELGRRKEKLSLKSEMERLGKPGTWFPKSYVAESLVDGKLSWRDTMQATDVTLNEAIPADTFRLAGMKIPIGWPMMGSALPDPKGRYKWDGKQPVLDDGPDAKEPPAKMSAVSAQSPQRTGLLAMGAALAVIGAIALGFYYWKR